MALFGSGMTRQALSTATVRAVESYRDEETRLYEDRIDVALLPPLWQAFVRPMRWSIVRRPLLAYRERQFPGVIGNLVCRTRFIDDVLQRELRDGVEQVVVLGAGFDTRAYRVPGIDDADVFEVDHPDVQEAKEKRVQSVFGSVPSHVTFVPVDFDTQELLTALDRTAYDRGKRTLFIWEGVTQYITEAAVGSTLRGVSTGAGDGSKLVFTYIKRGIVEGTDRTAVDETVMGMAEDQGSPWITGLDPDGLDAYLDERGLTLLEDVGATEYRDRYLDPLDRDTTVYEGERVAVAEIRSGESGAKS
jgi:methyltransferase (TIGR00027 family)